MNKIQASFAIGAITAVTALPLLGAWAILAGIGNMIFTHEFLTMKGH